MADSKISALSAVTAPLGTDELAVNQGGTSKKTTMDLLHTQPAVAVGSTPSAPPAGYGMSFARYLATRVMPAWIGPSGLDSMLQPHMARNGWAQWKPAGGSTTISAIGAGALTATGTATSASYATTSLHTRCTRVDYLVTTAATTAVAGYRFNTDTYRGTEGFTHIFRVCPATGVTGVSTRRCFVGMTTATSAPTDVDPASLVNCVGVGYTGGTDSNWQLLWNDGSGTCTKTDTGIAIPSADRQDVYSVFIFTGPASGVFGVHIIEESTGNAFASSGSSNVPGGSTGLSPRGWVSVGGTSSVCGMTLFSGYMETDN